MNAHTHEQGRSHDNGPFLLAKVLADALVTIGRPRPRDVHNVRDVRLGTSAAACPLCAAPSSRVVVDGDLHVARTERIGDERFDA